MLKSNSSLEKVVEIYTKKRYNSKGSSRYGLYAGIAQSVEHFTRNEGVVSSSLISGFTNKRRNPSDFKGLRLLWNKEEEQMKPSKEIIELFHNDRFATENGAVIEEVDDHYAKCSLMLEDRHRNAMGAVMGGVYFTLADFALAVASNWKKMGHVSLNSEITYLTAAKGNQLIAEAFCVKNGRTTGYYRIDVKDEFGNLAAAVTATTFCVTK